MRRCLAVPARRPPAVTHIGLLTYCAGAEPGLPWLVVNQLSPQLRALCVARHIFLAEHIARFFATLGIETRGAVGLCQASIDSREFDPDVVICEYELITTLSLEAWERDEVLSRCPVVAVSFTRKPHEAHTTDIDGIGGFLYLPLLNPEAAMRLIKAAGASPRNRFLLPSPIASPTGAIKA